MFKKESISRLIRKLRIKYRLVILNDQTLEEKLSFRLTRMNVFVLTGTLALLLIILTTYIIAFTPLREYIPGYTDVRLQKQVYELQLITDSLEHEFIRKDLYINNLKRLMEGDEILESFDKPSDTVNNYLDIDVERIPEDSMLREEVESLGEYNLYYGDDEELLPQTSDISGFMFFCPLKGIVTNDYNPEDKHYGIDIASEKNQPIKATLDGRVIFADWTVETGYVISIQHKYNLVTVYKHNSTLLKEQGNYVRAGEVIAIVGNSGELTTGPHLHFELWHNGISLDPKEYISF